MPNLRATITDDRGRRCPLVTHGYGLPFPTDPGHRARIGAASSKPQDPLTKPERRRIVLYGLLVLPLFIAMAFVPALLTFGLNLGWAAMPFALPLGLAPMILIIFVARRATGRRMARAYLRAELCPSCGYDLRTIESQGDGCRVCPECGTAWKYG